jgi:hypothetical protein
MGGYGFNPHTGKLKYSNSSSSRIEQIKSDIEQLVSACKQKTHNTGNGYEFYIKFQYDNFRFVRKYDDSDCENFTGSIFDLERCDFVQGEDYNKHIPTCNLFVRNKEYVKTESTQSIFKCPILQSYDRKIISQLKSLFEELINLQNSNHLIQ